jgi:error-prone DNA polymerase
MERVLQVNRAASLAHRPADRRRRDNPAWSRKREAISRWICSTILLIPFAELHAHSAYSFLGGASTRRARRAARLDLRAIA